MNLFRHMKLRVREYARAVADYPQGVLCAWCRKPNLFFDDIGFICITPDGYKDGKPTREGACCKSCWHGPLGQSHIAHFGLGDR